MRRRRKTRRKTGSRAPQLRKQTDRATPASTWRSSILEHDENLIPEESNETRGKGIYRTFSENKVFEIFRDMASDYGNPKPSLFASEHLSPQSEGGCERTVANRAALHCGWQGCVFPARSKDPKHSNNMKRDRPAEIHENKKQTTLSSCLLW